MTNSPLDAAPADGLERAFHLPEDVGQDADLVALYNEMVLRLRREASGLPMNTIQQLLIERIASFYVQIKFKENTGSFTMNQQKEFNAYWLQLTAEFNRLLAASDTKLRDAMVLEIEKFVVEATDQITDTENRQQVRRSMSEGFAAMGL